MSNEIDFDNLAKEALDNAREDRKRVEKSFEEMKDSLKIESGDDVQKAMLVGDKAIKLLELLNKTNSQIIQISQLAQKKPTKVEEDEEDVKGLTIADIIKAKKEKNSEIEVRVEVDETKQKKKKEKTA